MTKAPSSMKAPAYTYHPAIELGRLGAAFGIVLAHAAPDELGIIGQVSLSFFVVLTGFLAGKSYLRAKGDYRWSRRAARLIVPLAVGWVLFFAVAWRVDDDHDPFAWLTSGWSLLSGPAYHLWFLPFLMAASALVRPIGSFVTSDRRLAIALILLVAASYPTFLIHYDELVPRPLAQWAVVMPMFVWGLLWAFAVDRRRSVWVTLAMAGMTLGAVLATRGQEMWAWALPLSEVLVLILWRLPARRQNWAWMGAMAFGIYLIHPLALLIGYKLFGAQIDPVALGLFGCLASFTAVAMTQRLSLPLRLVLSGRSESRAQPRRRLTDRP